MCHFRIHPFMFALARFMRAVMFQPECLVQNTLRLVPLHADCGFLRLISAWCRVRELAMEHEDYKAALSRKMGSVQVQCYASQY